MSDDFRRKALDVFRLVRATSQIDRKMRLRVLAQAWLNLADHERRVRQLEAETERVTGAHAAEARQMGEGPIAQPIDSVRAKST